MIIVAGSLTVEASKRASYLADCAPVVETARHTPGCLDFALSADVVDESRINVYERWDSIDSLHRFRGAGPSADQRATLLEIDVAEYTVDPTPPDAAPPPS